MGFFEKCIALVVGVVTIAASHSAVCANTYRLTTRPMTWSEASAEASRVGGHLVVIDSLAEQRLLVTLFGPGSRHIGLTDRNSEGRFTWVTGKELTFTNWASGEPNDARLGEDAVYMYGSNGTWNDADGNSRVHGIIEFEDGATSPDTTNNNSGAGNNSVELLVSDMQGNHEGLLHGVPNNYSWARGPEVKAIANNPVGLFAIQGWGIVYESANGNPAWNSRVQLRDMQTWLLSRSSGTWYKVQGSTSVAGGAYREDFSTNNLNGADVRSESDGGVSVRAGNGYNFHFWPTSGRAAISPSDVGGVFTAFRARLILDNPAGPDDRSAARYLAAVGGDYWISQTAQWQSHETNPGIGTGKAKFVSSNWKSFNFHSLTAEQIRANPPPLE